MFPIRAKKESGLRNYLKEQGLTKNSDPKLLEAAKRTYQRHYNRNYKQQRRKEYPEVTVSLSQNQYHSLTQFAQGHHLTLASFLREAALAYCNSTFVVPNHAQVASVEQKLLLMQTDVHMIAKHLKKLSIADLSQAYTALEDRFLQLEQYVTQRLREPRQVEEIIKNTLQSSSNYSLVIRRLLDMYDHQDL
ncbi:MAG: hypothetical protein AAFY71_19825 [Bacteroidota bacterium]